MAVGVGISADMWAGAVEVEGVRRSGIRAAVRAVVVPAAGMAGIGGVEPLVFPRLLDLRPTRS